MAIFSWIYSFLVYMVLILPHSQFTMDTTGLFNCEPYYVILKDELIDVTTANVMTIAWQYNDKSIIITAFMLFFLPSIFSIVFCYSTIFFVAHRQLKQIQFSSRHESIGRHFIKFENNQMVSWNTAAI